MTWAEFKTYLEDHGVKDSDVIHSIEVYVGGGFVVEDLIVRVLDGEVEVW